MSLDQHGTSGQHRRSTIVSLTAAMRRQELFDALGVALRAALDGPGGGAARDQLDELGIGEATRRRFDIGLYTTPKEVAESLVGAGFSTEEVASIGLSHAAWTNSFVGPWRNQRGRTITYFSREIAASAFTRRLGVATGEAVVYGLEGAVRSSRGTEHVVLVEDVLDAILIQDAGFLSVVAIGGMGEQMTRNRWEGLARIGIEQVTLMTSGTERSLMGAMTAIRAAQTAVVSPRLFATDPVSLPPAVTPGELIRRSGISAFRDALTHRIEPDMFLYMYTPAGAGMD